MALKRYITLDGYKYAVTSGTYLRKWERSFSTDLTGHLIRINYVDRGPGVEVYSMTLELATWPIGSTLYNDGITQSAETQMANLEASYLKISTSLHFLDPYGQAPRQDISTGIIFVNLDQILPNFSTSEKSYYKAQITLTEAAGLQIT